MSYSPYPMSFNHACIAQIITEANQVSKGSGIGRTTLQKILYFLQSCEVPISYKFDVHHFGPFCSEILHDTEWLQALELIGDTSDNPGKYSNYHVTESGSKWLATCNDQISSYSGIIRGLVTALAPCSISDLELFSTLHYAYRDVAATKTDLPTKDQVFKRFKEFKRDRFDDTTLQSACKVMSDARLLQFD